MLRDLLRRPAVLAASSCCITQWLCSDGGAAAVSDAQPPTWRRGLIGAGATAAYYSDRLELDDADRILKERGYMWRAVEADAAALGATADAYMAGVCAKALEFIRSKTVHDREPIRGHLQDLFRSEGAFALVLGGNVRVLVCRAAHTRR